ncbi:hypothetical protein CG716_01825 [Mycolicibacterium sphagni]|uniref:Uncharacterized protein n=1 Tax=Mycolicibacterium sphagni TaxID=1786 RepID=A0A255DV91_9MYCO|nr:hypothetical protein CG716_01825 [Mycolicibacterium sphagni]
MPELGSDEMHSLHGPFGPRCSTHANVKSPRSCDGCRTALKAAQKADRDRRHAIRAAIDSCNDCDPYGRLWADDDTSWVDCPEHSNFRVEALAAEGRLL